MPRPVCQNRLILTISKVTMAGFVKILLKGIQMIPDFVAGAGVKPQLLGAFQVAIVLFGNVTAVEYGSQSYGILAVKGMTTVALCGQQHTVGIHPRVFLRGQRYLVQTIVVHELHVSKMSRLKQVWIVAFMQILPRGSWVTQDFAVNALGIAR